MTRLRGMHTSEVYKCTSLKASAHLLTLQARRGLRAGSRERAAGGACARGVLCEGVLGLP